MDYHSPIGCGLSAWEEEKFRKWAFGPDYLFIDDFKDALKAWNKLHSHKLKLTLNGLMSKDVAKMVELWREDEDQNS